MSAARYCVGGSPRLACRVKPLQVASGGSFAILGRLDILYIITVVENVFKEAAMTCRIICPYCHCAVDPLTLEAAVSAHAEYRICPECDTAIVVSLPGAQVSEAIPLPASHGLEELGFAPPAHQTMSPP